ncbi:hypothetical protein PVK06_042887 [Gossypium arboreum]|uniref:Uncharacterized protein n=1 Tax=Gossypium arboreum TaxID=29729 RepID=A0ABR0MME1_GOSAR|nr:hypothetical protein PVK06_042887 [Gossypium arboreum]
MFADSNESVINLNSNSNSNSKQQSKYSHTGLKQGFPVSKKSVSGCLALPINVAVCPSQIEIPSLMMLVAVAQSITVMAWAISLNLCLLASTTAHVITLKDKTSATYTTSISTCSYLAGVNLRGTQGSIQRSLPCFNISWNSNCDIGLVHSDMKQGAVFDLSEELKHQWFWSD